MKKVLYITYDFPYPLNSGGKNRAFNMLKNSGKDIEKYLISFVREDFKKDNASKVEDIGVKVLDLIPRKRVKNVMNLIRLVSGGSIFKVLYYSDETLSKITKAVRENNIDIVHFESFYTAYFISDKLRDLGVKQIYGSENIEAKIYKDYVDHNVSKVLRPVYKQQLARIEKEEIGFYKNADLCIAVSDIERKYIEEFNKNCKVVRNGVDLSEFKYKRPTSEKGNKLLFVGNFTYFPNVDAIHYFYKEIFHDLNEDVRLTIVGKGAGNLPFRDDRVVLKNYVNRIQDEYEKADIMVAPIRLGGGTNFKIIEAMAVGLPVISLPDRLEGLDVVDEKHIIIAQNAWDFVAKVKNLVNDLDSRRKIAENARQLIEKEYSWEVIGDNLNRVWKSL